MRRFILVWGLVGLLGCHAAAPAPGEPLAVFAAASTQQALTEALHDFEAATGVAVRASFLASSDLAVQIAHGADADLFLSADERWADYLADKGLVGRRRDLLGNRLVVVVPADSALQVRTLADLAQPGVRRLAVALDSVPAGRYARTALQKAGVWKKVEDRVLEAGSVTAALTYVARGETDAGLVYATDAASSTKVRQALVVPTDLHAPIRYPLVLIRRAHPHPVAGRLYDYLGTDRAALAAFRKAGFTILKEQ
jgi:molybdate transport system substrate-binding protein